MRREAQEGRSEGLRGRMMVVVVVMFTDSTWGKAYVVLYVFFLDLFFYLW